MKILSSSKSFKQFVLCCVLAVAAAFIGGCSRGNSGSDGASGAAGTSAPPADSTGIKATITSAVIDTATGSVTVNFTLTDSQGFALEPSDPSINGKSFVIARLGTDRNYKSMILSSGGQPAPDSGGTFSGSNGSYTYTFGQTIAVDATKTYTVAAYIGRTVKNAGGKDQNLAVNPRLDFRIDGSAVPATDHREVVAIDQCNQCHGTLSAHEGNRRDIALCVLCHNPGMTDPDTGNSIDFKSLIHKIHMGQNLPSNANGSHYTIIGYQNSVNDFSTVKYPARTGDNATENRPVTCTKCHKAGKDTLGNTYGADVDLWKETPTIANCTTCHDLTTFDGSTTISVVSGTTAQTMTAAPHSGGVKADGTCATCHDQTVDTSFGGVLSVQAVHLTPRESTLNKGITFKINSVEGTVSGLTPTVHFSVQDSTGADYQLVGGSTQVVTFASGATTTVADACTVVLAYMTGPDYDNSASTFQKKTGSSAAYIQGVTVTVSSTSADPSLKRVGGEYVVSMGTVTVPVGVVGTVAVYGKQAILVPVNSATGHRVDGVVVSVGTNAGTNKAFQHVTSANAGSTSVAYYNFNTTDGSAATAAQLRREVVSIDNCNVCHTSITIHGSRSETKLCVMCHAPNLYATSSPGFSGNLKDFVHNIHGEQALQATTTSVFRGTEPVGYPNDDKNCTACHISDPMATLSVPYGAVGSIRSNTTNTIASTGTRVAPIGAACTSCHDSATTAAHVNSEATYSGTVALESCAVCHANGKLVGNVHDPVK